MEIFFRGVAPSLRDDFLAHFAGGGVTVVGLS
jgi:hypothetical protein